MDQIAQMRRQIVTVDSLELEVLNGSPGPPGSHFRLPTGEVFGFPWKPEQLYRSGEWIVGISAKANPGRANYSAHTIRDGTTAWNADLDGGSQFTMDADGRGFNANSAHARFDLFIRQVLQTRDGYCSVLDFNAGLARGYNVVFVGNDGHLRWTMTRPDGQPAGAYMSVRINKAGEIEVWHDRYMAVIDPTSGKMLASRP